MEQTAHLHIRDARDNEREAMREITRAAYEEYMAVMSPPFWQAYWQVVQASIDEQGPERIVAELDNVLVGSVLLYPPGGDSRLDSGGCSEVRSLAVLPAVRGQGVGSALMRECERRARLSGAAILSLHTMDVMGDAMHMYERMGYVRVPALDFRPVREVLIKGYQRKLDT